MELGGLTRALLFLVSFISHEVAGSVHRQCGHAPQHVLPQPVLPTQDGKLRVSHESTPRLLLGSEDAAADSTSKTILQGILYERKGGRRMSCAQQEPVDYQVDLLADTCCPSSPEARPFLRGVGDSISYFSHCSDQTPD